MPTILLTGGTGYIGSHTCVELIGAGYETILNEGQQEAILLLFVVEQRTDMADIGEV